MIVAKITQVNTCKILEYLAQGQIYCYDYFLINYQHVTGQAYLYGNLWLPFVVKSDFSQHLIL